MTGTAWHLVADIGGTNARFAVADTVSSRLLMTRRYAVAEYAALADVMARFLADMGENARYRPFPEAACLALASSLSGDSSWFTNHFWRVDRQEIGEQLGQAPVELINDFAAVGYAVPGLQAQDWIDVCPGPADPDSPAVVLGPGTGLGVCTVVPVRKGFRVLPGEGGHGDFSPVDDIEVEILGQLSARYGRVSAERILSGPGLENIHQALTVIGQQTPQPLAAADISRAATAGTDPLAREAVAIFCRALGSFAGNLALTLGAKGGVYITGGLIPHFPGLFLDSGFRERFQDKGRLRHYLSAIPVRLVTRDNPGLVGAATKLTLSEA